MKSSLGDQCDLGNYVSYSWDKILGPVKTVTTCLHPYGIRIDIQGVTLGIGRKKDAGSKGYDSDARTS